LAIIGGKDSVAALASLLGDEKLSHMARYGLERNPDPAVDEAFRDALGKLKGRPLVGVIGSIGVRRDGSAVKPLSRMLQDSNPDVAQAAARALGSIGNQFATRALQSALQNVSAENKLAVCEGLLRCAETHVIQGRREVAIEIYDQLRSLQAPHQVRGGALRGAILTRGKDGVALTREHLRSKDYIMFSAAVQAAQEMEGSEVTKALTAAIKGLGADNQALIIMTLGKRGDAAAAPTLFELAKRGQRPVRMLAIRALPEIAGAYAEAAPVLVGLLGDSDDKITKTAKAALTALPYEISSAYILKMLESDDRDKQLVALDLLGHHREASSIPALLKTVEKGEPRVRRTALRRIGEIGGPEQVSALLGLLMNYKDTQDIRAAEQAVTAVCTKADNPQSYTDKLTSLLAKASPVQKAALLRVLGVIGGPKALDVVLAAVGDSNAEVHGAAIRALGAWKSANAAPHLLALAKKATNQNEKTLLLRGYLGLASRPDLPGEQRMSMCRQAEGLLQRNDEKKLLLGALSNINSADAAAMIAPYLDSSGTREEACAALVSVADKLLQGSDASKVAPKLIKPLEKVSQVTTNTNLARRAKRLLRQARSK
jgi:HEAT repeat protein